MELRLSEMRGKIFLVFLFYMDMDCAGNEELAADRLLNPTRISGFAVQRRPVPLAGIHVRR